MYRQSENVTKAYISSEVLLSHTNVSAPTGTEVMEYMEDTQNRRERRREKWEDIFL